MWLEDRPIAAITYTYTGTAMTPATTTTSYVETDHLATPRLITNASRQKRWTWESAPYGDTFPNENPQALGAYNYNLRFPGQYFDAETNHHYNHHRDYESTTGRYVQSDPIGLEGGVNTYGYAMAAPVMFKDVWGLVVLRCERPVDINWLPSGSGNYLPYHNWLKTDTLEAGMGGECPVPGQQCSDRPYAATNTISHAGQSSAPNASCTPVKDIDEICVNNAIRPGQPTGLWLPWNQCQSFVNQVINRCSRAVNSAARDELRVSMGSTTLGGDCCSCVGLCRCRLCPNVELLLRLAR